jgi:uncharacterized protein (DUF2141 family)
MTPSILRRAAGLGAVLSALALGGGAQAECFGTPTGVKVTVVVDNVRNNQGLMAVTIYQEKGFLKKGGSLKVWREPAKPGAQPLCFYLAAPGAYAFAVFQDLDSDHKLDYNLLKGPTEPWGFSNNPRAIWPLRFSKASVAVPAGATTIHTRLNY